MNKCDDIRTKLMELDFSTAISESNIEQHLSECESCSGFYQDLVALQDKVEEMPEYDVSEEVFTQTLAAVQASQTTNSNIKSATRISQQWATGLAASFVLVAVAGLLYNGSLSEFQGDFSQVELESKQDVSVKNKETVWIDPQPADEGVTVEFIDISEVRQEVLAQQPVMSRSAPAKPNPSINGTLSQIQEQEMDLGYSAGSRSEQAAPPVEMPEILEEAEIESSVQDAEPVSAIYSDEQDSLVEVDRIAVTGSRIKRTDLDDTSAIESLDQEKKAKKENHPVTTKESPQMSLDDLLKHVQRSATESSNENLERESYFRSYGKKSTKQKPKPAAPPEDGLVANMPARESSVESNDTTGRYRREANKDSELLAERKVVADDSTEDRRKGQQMGGKGRLNSIDLNQVAQQYLAQMSSTENLSFKQATGYWANTYVPGDSNMRWLQAKLQQTGELNLPEVRSNLQPFDVPNNSALAFYLNSDQKSVTEGPTRMRLQVGIQAGAHQGGHRSALKLAVVLDVQGSSVQTEVKSLLSALLKNKQVSDQITVFVTGNAGGQIIKADDFKHGPIQVALANLSQTSKKPHVSLKRNMSAAYSWLQDHDDPNAVLGSSAVWLISANTSSAQLAAIEPMVQQQATDGITFSSLAIGDHPERMKLERLALMGQGHSRVMVNDQDAQRVISEELLTSSKAVARALRLQIKLAEGVKLIDVLGSYSLDEVQAQQVRAAEQSLDQRMAKNWGITADRGQDEDGIQMVIPSYFAGDTHVILLDVLVSKPGPIAEVNAKYKDLIHLRNARSSMNLEIQSGQHEPGPLELNVMKNVLTYRFTLALRQAGNDLRSGDHQAAINQLNSILKIYQAMRQKFPAWKDDSELMLDERAIKQYLQLLNNQSSIDPSQYQLIVDSMSLMSWQRLLSHGP